jgi:hypothetical protein
MKAGLAHLNPHAVLSALQYRRENDGQIVRSVDHIVVGESCADLRPWCGATRVEPDRSAGR